MMRLSLMKAFFNTVGADGSSAFAEQIAAPWFGEGAHVQVWRASANFVCKLEAEGQTFFLRFNHESERSAAEIASELGLIEHLAQNGLCVARPQLSCAGRLMESVATGQGEFHAVLFSALPGLEKEFAQLDLADFERWGRALAELHRAARGYMQGGRPSWEKRLELARQEISEDEILACHEMDKVEAALRQLPRDAEHFGLIHYDFELDNLRWQSKDIGILDFDDCGAHWYAADVAYALRDLFNDSCAQIDLSDARLQSFVTGYRLVMPLAEEMLLWLPLFLRLHNLVAFARICRSLGGGQLPGEPAWLGGLRIKLIGILEGYRRDFALSC